MTDDAVKDLGTKAAESALKALSPAKSTYYFPVAVAVFALGWVSDEVSGLNLWTVMLILIAVIVGLSNLAWRSRLELRGITDAEEFRAARTIALTGAIITLVSALHAISAVSWMVTVHFAACSLQMVIFFLVTWQDKGKKLPRGHVNLVQLTLILSVLLGGAAYLLGKSAHDVAEIAAASKQMESAKTDFEKNGGVYPSTQNLEAANERIKSAMTKGREGEWTYGIAAFGLYAVWLTAGTAWFRSRRSKRKT